MIHRSVHDESFIGSALTDALIAGIANGSKAYKLVGSYVSTPLNWSLSPISTSANALSSPS
jgi:hypothetical protein